MEALRVKAGKTKIVRNPKGQRQIHTEIKQGQKAKVGRHLEDQAIVMLSYKIRFTCV